CARDYYGSCYFHYW
nr:immunoglobulin heavy chain junction region [Mus musculus]